MRLVLWIAGVFRHHSGVCHIIYGIGVLIEELCSSPLLFLCVLPFGMYLDDDEDISVLVELVSCFCKSEFNGCVIDKILE